MTHISSLQLHRLRLGELDAAAEHAARVHIAACDVCERRLCAQQDARAAFLRAPVPEVLTSVVEPPPVRRRAVPWTVGVGVALPLAAAALLYVRTPSAPTTPLTDVVVSSSEPTREKGFVPSLEAWVQVGESARPLYTGERLHAGDRVQLKFDAGRRRFVTLAGRDVRGSVEVYGTIPADGPGLRAAPFSLTLDDAGGEQRFYAVLTDARPRPEDVQVALGVEPVRMDRADVASVVLLKE